MNYDGTTNIIVYSLPFLDFYTKKYVAVFILKVFFVIFCHFIEDLVTKALSNWKIQDSSIKKLCIFSNYDCNVL